MLSLTHTHIHTHALSHSHAHTHACMHTHTHMHACTHTHTQIMTLQSLLGDSYVYLASSEQYTSEASRASAS